MRHAPLVLAAAGVAALSACLPVRRAASDSELAASLQEGEIVTQSCTIRSDWKTESAREIAVRIEVTPEAQRFVATGFKELARSETLLTRGGNFRLDHDGQQLAMALAVIGAKAEKELHESAAALAGWTPLAASVAKATESSGGGRQDALAVQAAFGFARDEDGDVVGQYTLAGKIEPEGGTNTPPFAIAWSTSDKVPEQLVGVTWWEEPYFPQTASWVLTDREGTRTNKLACERPVRTQDARRVAILKKEAAATDGSFDGAIVKAERGSGEELSRYLTHVAGVGAAAAALQTIDGDAEGRVPQLKAQAKAGLAWICFTSMRSLLDNLRAYACKNPASVAALKDPAARDAFLAQTTDAFRNAISTDGFVLAAFQGLGEAGTPEAEATALLKSLSRELCEDPLQRLVTEFKAPDCQRL